MIKRLELIGIGRLSTGSLQRHLLGEKGANPNRQSKIWYEAKYGKAVRLGLTVDDANKHGLKMAATLQSIEVHRPRPTTKSK